MADEKKKTDNKLNLKNIVATIIASVSVMAIGASAKAILDVRVLQAQRVEDVKSIDNNGAKIDNLQKEMNNNFKTVIKLLK